MTGPEFAPEPRIHTRRPLVEFATRNVPPPAPLYVTANDRLHVRIDAGSANPNLLLTGRLLAPDGNIRVLQYPFGGYATETVTTDTRDLAEGFLLGLTLAAEATVFRGQVFVTIALQWGGRTGAAITQTLMADYVTQFGLTGWPQGELRARSDGRGFTRFQDGGDPVAGLDFSFSPGARARSLLLAVSGLLTTSVTVANRFVNFVVSDGSGNLAPRVPFNHTQVASTAIRYAAFVGASSQVAVNNVVMAPLPAGIYLESPTAIAALTANLQAGDDWSDVEILTEDWRRDN